jgi:hypothetical protein
MRLFLNSLGLRQGGMFETNEQKVFLIWVKTWGEALDLLKAEWGDRVNVAIYPDGSVQYFPSSM